MTKLVDAAPELTPAHRDRLTERFDEFDTAVAVDPAAATVTVALRARMSLVLAGDVGGIPITAEATATAPLD